MKEIDTPRRRVGAPTRLDDAKACNLMLDAKTRDILKRLGNGKMSVGARIAASIADGPIKAPRWLPIETAPKDGRDLILLLTPSGWPQVAYSNTWWTSGFSVECTPTRWMPLPPV